MSSFRLQGKEWLRLLRVSQYVKNGFIVLPVFFAGQLLHPAVILRLLGAVCAFSALASAVYIFNDWQDLEADRKHPTNRFRPLATGAIEVRQALLFMAGIALAGLGGLYLLGAEEALIGMAYLALNAAYSLGLKRIALLDLFLVATGFVLRLMIGARIPEAEAPLSEWIVVMTFLLALFLGFGKRREEVLLAFEGGPARESVRGYNLVFVNGAMLVMASVIMVAYLAYTLSPEVQQRVGSNQLYLTAIFVVLGMFRYLQITFVEENSGNPTRIFWQDRFLQVVIAGWVFVFFIFLYSSP